MFTGTRTKQCDDCASLFHSPPAQPPCNRTLARISRLAVRVAPVCAHARMAGIPTPVQLAREAGDEEGEGTAPAWLPMIDASRHIMSQRASACPRPSPAAVLSAAIDVMKLMDSDMSFARCVLMGWDDGSAVSSSQHAGSPAWNAAGSSARTAIQRAARIISQSCDGNADTARALRFDSVLQNGILLSLGSRNPFIRLSAVRCLVAAVETPDPDGGGVFAEGYERRTAEHVVSLLSHETHPRVFAEAKTVAVACINRGTADIHAEFTRTPFLIAIVHGMLSTHQVMMRMACASLLLRILRTCENAAGVALEISYLPNVVRDLLSADECQMRILGMCVVSTLAQYGYRAQAKLSKCGVLHSVCGIIFHRITGVVAPVPTTPRRTDASAAGDGSGASPGIDVVADTDADAGADEEIVGALHASGRPHVDVDNELVAALHACDRLCAGNRPNANTAATFGVTDDDAYTASGSSTPIVRVPDIGYIPGLIATLIKQRSGIVQETALCALNTLLECANLVWPVIVYGGVVPHAVALLTSPSGAVRIQAFRLLCLLTDDAPLAEDILISLRVHVACARAVVHPEVTRCELNDAMELLLTLGNHNAKCYDDALLVNGLKKHVWVHTHSTNPETETVASALLQELAEQCHAQSDPHQCVWQTVIESLPRIPAARSYGLPEGSCPVCFGALSLGEVVALPCAHKFHVPCITTWFRTDVNMRCPSCRQTTGHMALLTSDIDRKV